jgi:hypothetical protein
MDKNELEGLSWSHLNAFSRAPCGGVEGTQGNFSKRHQSTNGHPNAVIPTQLTSA